MRNFARILYLNFKQHMFWIVVRITLLRRFYKYQKHMFYEELRIKQGISYISFCPSRIRYNSKFILMATYLGTNAVVVTRVHCTSLRAYADTEGPDQHAHLCSLIKVFTVCKHNHWML